MRFWHLRRHLIGRSQTNTFGSPPPITARKRTKVHFEREISVAKQPREILKYPRHRAVILLGTNASLLTTHTQSFDKNFRLIPEEYITLKGPVEKIIAEAIAHVDAND